MSLTFQHLRTDAQVMMALPLASQLRPHLKQDEFLTQIREQEKDRYRLYGGFVGGELVVLSGVRDSCTLARGRHIFVDDLVTLAGKQGLGYGKAMLHFLADYGRQLGVPRMYLDSRDTARTFYEQVGFTFLTSIPCWIDLDVMDKGRSKSCGLS